MTNPITDLSAGAFLVFYAKTIAVVLAAFFVYLRLSDRTRHLPATVGFAVDPYEVAYLRGGINETARAAIIALAECGVLELEGDVPRHGAGASGGERTLVQSARSPSSGRLSALEREVYDWFREPRTIGDLFRADTPARLATFCLPFEERLGREGLLRQERAPLWLGMAVSAIVIAGTGVLRLMVGLSRERPVGFLVLMGLAGLGLVLALGMTNDGRLSARGRAFLAKLRAQVESPTEPESNAWWTLAAAVVGPSILAGTSLAALGGEFRKSARSAMAGCGAGWVADGGGGDGGGGGADGGGGGCGGGCGGCGS